MKAADVAEINDHKQDGKFKGSPRLKEHTCTDGATLRRHVITQPQRIPITARVTRYVVSSVKPMGEQEYYRIWL